MTTRIVWSVVFISRHIRTPMQPSNVVRSLQLYRLKRVACTCCCWECFLYVYENLCSAGREQIHIGNTFVGNRLLWSARPLNWTPQRHPKILMPRHDYASLNIVHELWCVTHWILTRNTRHIVEVSVSVTFFRIHPYMVVGATNSVGGDSYYNFTTRNWSSLKRGMIKYGWILAAGCSRVMCFIILNCLPTITYC